MSSVVLTERVGRVLVVTLNRPEVRNAINNEMSDGVLAAQQQLDADSSLSVGVLTGAGAGFCAGLDLKAFAVEGFPRSLRTVLRSASQKPMLAAVEGFAFAGGLELALSCDCVVAGEGARFAVAEVTRGLVAIGGALVRLPRAIPLGNVMLMALTGDPVAADEALRLGLVTQLVDAGKSLDAALQLATRMAANAPLSLIATKQLVRAAQGRTEEEYWAQQRVLAKEALQSKDAQEGPHAFIESRQPVWVGE